MDVRRFLAWARSFLFRACCALSQSTGRGSRRGCPRGNAATADITQDTWLKLARRTAALLAEAIDNLPSQTKRIFLMNRFDGMTHRAIAEEIGISETAVYYHLRRALEHLASIRQHLPD